MHFLINTHTHPADWPEEDSNEVTMVTGKAAKQLVADRDRAATH